MSARLRPGTPIHLPIFRSAWMHDHRHRRRRRHSAPRSPLRCAYASARTISLRAHVLRVRVRVASVCLFVRVRCVQCARPRSARMCCDGASARKRGTEKTRVCAYMWVRVWVHTVTLPRWMSGWKIRGVTSIFENSVHSREMRSYVSVFFNTLVEQGVTIYILPCDSCEKKFALFVNETLSCLVRSLRVFYVCFPSSLALLSFSRIYWFCFNMESIRKCVRTKQMSRFG